MVQWVKNPPASAGDTGDKGSIPGSRGSPGEGNGHHSSILTWETPMDKGAWQATVYGVAKSRTSLSMSKNKHVIYRVIKVPQSVVCRSGRLF